LGETRIVNKKLLFLITEDWYFCSHRLPLACAAKAKGFDVAVATRVSQHGPTILEHGIRLLPIRLRRRGNHLWEEFLSFLEIWRIYRTERPDIVHHVALKPLLYGSLAAALTPEIKVVNAIAGLGFVFSSRQWRARVMRPVIKLAFRLLLGRANSRVIVQNVDDRDLLIHSLNISARRVALIRGSGVNIDEYHVTPEPPGDVIVALVSRMLWDKGVGEFVAAVEQLKAEGLQFRAWLVGDTDPDNPAAIDPQQLQTWQREGQVEWLGHRQDIAQLWAQAHIAVLPSYREGLPKSLLEAASCGRPIITADVPGCREIVADGVNGLLVPARSVNKLAQAMKTLISDPALRQDLGQRGRDRVLREFSEQRVIEETLAVYDALLLAATQAETQP